MTTPTSDLWTRKEREELRRELAKMSTEGFREVEQLSAARILATVDALEKALAAAQETIHGEFCGDDDDHLEHCQQLVDLLAALEAK